jgi:predicted transglutaminase-like cysteine proteinase
MSRFTKRAICAVLGLTLFPVAAQAAPLNGSPSGIFGTAAVAVASTPYNAKWTRVLGSTIPTSNAISSQAVAMFAMDRLRFVNLSVNRATRFLNDSQNGQPGDSWATAAETLARGAGDCEDYAIAKMQILRSAGIPASDLFLVIGYDLDVRSAHAVLVVRLGMEYWVLDNLTNEVRQPKYYPDFRPVVSFSANGKWLHGYRPGQMPNEVAVQRVTSHSSGRDRLALAVARQAGG